MGALAAAVAVGGLAHACAAALWWYLAPAGFPPAHPQFLAGVVLPAVVVALGLVALIPRFSHAGLASWTAMWCAGALTGLALYSDGRVRIALACAVPCGVLLATCLAVSLVDRSRWNRTAAVLALIGTAVGIAFPVAVRAPLPSTTPLGGEPPRLAGDALVPGWQELRDGVEVDSRTALCRISRADLDVEIRPLLRFHSRSPDRGWTLFTRPGVCRADRALRATRAVATANGVRLFAQGVALHLLDAEAGEEGALRIDAWSQLDAPEFAHQASCAEFTVRGLAHPRVEFSTSPGHSTEIVPHDYPAGRPLRFATLMPDATLRVVEATSGEKGPFATLCEGALERDEPLEVVLYDGDRRRIRIVLHDYASQASVDLSPTAGWGVPQNSISFSQQPNGGAVRVLAKWASTGIGRGFDTVGHATGTYRNRIDVEILR